MTPGTRYTHQVAHFADTVFTRYLYKQTHGICVFAFINLHYTLETLEEYITKKPNTYKIMLLCQLLHKVKLDYYFPELILLTWRYPP